MSSNLITYLIAALTMIVCAIAAFGFPAVAIVLIKYFKLKERELVLEMEYRQKAQDQQFITDERLQRLEQALSGLDRDGRLALGTDESAAAPSSRSEPTAR
jgi:hypothetical protein